MRRKKILDKSKDMTVSIMIVLIMIWLGTFNEIKADELGADGYYHCKQLPAGVTADKYEIQYQNYYERVQENSPGNDWQNAGKVSEEWVNSGDMYFSVVELPVSDERVLIEWTFFHVCGANTGEYSSYKIHGDYVHVDSVSPDQVNVVSTGIDSDGNVPFYVLNWKNGNGKVYCQSGVTCDGAYGTHGKRGWTWYKKLWYQDRKKVTKYKYTMTSDWTGSADAAAASVEIRYKLKHVHSYTSRITQEATCGREGVRTYTCSCGNSYTEKIAKLSTHNYVKSVVAPTASQKGYKLYTCAVCSDSYKEYFAENLYQIMTISFKDSSKNFRMNEKKTLSVLIQPEELTGAVTIQWKSDDKEIATVDSTGVIHAVGMGEAHITASLPNGNTARCKVIVTNGVEAPPISYSTTEKMNTRDLQKGQMIADRETNGNYIVTSEINQKPTVKYIGMIDGTKSEIKLPRYVVYMGLSYEVTEIQSRAVYGNKTLKKVSIGKATTIIGDSAFENCTSLKKVVIGADVRKIGKNAWKGCKRLKKITVKSTKLRKVGKNALKGIHKKCRIKVPKAKLKEYQKLFKKRGQKATVKITK